MDQKLKVGWFSFTCCEDSTILFTEILNTHYKEWLTKIEFVHAKIFQKDDTGEMKDMDIAFVEGAISSDSQEAKLKRIREKAKKVIAVGSCAVLGAPANQRNFFNRDQLAEIAPILEKFKYKQKVMKLKDVVIVDETIPGCPMDEKIFLQIMEKYLNA